MSAAGTFNQVILLGNLGNDAPVLRHTQSGQAVCNFKMCTDRTVRNADGTYGTEPVWTTIVVWGKRAEAVAKYLGKKQKVQVVGTLRHRSYDDPKGGNLHEMVSEAINGTMVAHAAKGNKLWARWIQKMIPQVCAQLPAGAAKRYVTEVIAKEVHFLGGGGKPAENAYDNDVPPPPAPDAETVPETTPDDSNYEQEWDEEDFPF